MITLAAHKYFTGIAVAWLKLPAFVQTIAVWLLIGLMGVFGALIVQIYNSTEMRLSKLEGAIEEYRTVAKEQTETIAALKTQFDSWAEEHSSNTQRRDTASDAIVIRELKVAVAELKTSYKNLQGTVFKTQALSAGFRKPEIITTSLKQNARFESKVLTQAGVYDLKFTVVGYDRAKKILSITFEGTFEEIRFNRNFMILSPGVATQFPFTQPDLPPIALLFLDVPTYEPDEAVLAIGLKADSASRVS